MCINFSKLQGIIDQDTDSAIQSLKDALVFFPRSAEANENIAQFLRVQADTEEKLTAVENFLRKSVSCKEQILSAIQDCSASRATITMLSAAANTAKLAGNGSSSKSHTSKVSKMEIENDNEDEDNNEGGEENDDEDDVDDDDGDDDDDKADLIEADMLQRILERELGACERASENLALFL